MKKTIVILIINLSVRQQLMKNTASLYIILHKIKENAVLHRYMLAEVDKESAKNIHPNNVKRVIRALEYYKETGNKISTHNETQRQKVSPYNFAYFVLNDDRKKLYEKN